MAELTDTDVPNMAESAPNLGDAIKQRLAETVKNVDIVSMLQKMAAVAPENEETQEIQQKLQGILQKYNDMSDADKAQFSTQLKEVLANRVAMKLDTQSLNLDGLQEAIGEAILYRLALVGFVALLLIVLFVFFGYKLYKSIKEKELRREEKKKAKQMKKKK